MAEDLTQGTFLQALRSLPSQWGDPKITTRLSSIAQNVAPWYREVVALRDLEELSAREVAEQLGLTRVNVRVRLHRARTALPEQLQPRLDAAYRAACMPQARCTT